MQARIVELREAEERGHSVDTPTSPGQRVQHVSDDVMLAKLANEGWAEHVTTESE